VHLTGLCALAACPYASASLPPLPPGVGVHGGTEAVGHALHHAMKLLPLLGNKAAGPGRVTRASFAEGVLRELSLGLSGQICYCTLRVSVYWLCPAAPAVWAGLSVPTDVWSSVVCSLLVLSCSLAFALPLK
jgi:hypothetical protein